MEDKKSYLNTFKLYFQLKNFNFKEILVIGLLSIILLVLSANLGLGDYKHFDYSFGKSRIIFIIYFILIFGIVIVLATFLFKYFYPHEHVSMNKGNVIVFNVLFMFFYFLPTLFCHNIHYAFTEIKYNYVGLSNYTCYQEYGPVEKNQGPYEDYEFGYYKVCRSYSDDFCFLNDKECINKLLNREGENSITNQFVYWQTAIVCGYFPSGKIANKINYNQPYGLSGYVNYFIKITPKYFTELLISTIREIGWLVNLILLHYIFFFFKLKTGFFYEILSNKRAT